MVDDLLFYVKSTNKRSKTGEKSDFSILINVNNNNNTPSPKKTYISKIDNLSD